MLLAGEIKDRPDRLDGPSLPSDKPSHIALGDANFERGRVPLAVLGDLDRVLVIGESVDDLFDGFLHSLNHQTQRRISAAS